jgi:hypothetical protein
LVSVRMAAHTPATTTFTASPADFTPAHLVLLFGLPAGVPTDQIDYGTTSITIAAAASVAATSEGDALAEASMPIMALAAASPPISSIDDPLADPAPTSVVATPNESDTTEPMGLLAAEPSGQGAGTDVEAVVADPVDLGLDAVLADIAAEVTQAWADV